jgi:hypothetical protein
METIRTNVEERWASPRGMLVLWGIALVGPVTWAVRFTAVYVMAGTACTGTGVAVMVAASIVAIGLSLGGAWAGWHIWSELGAGHTAAGGVAGRTRFMAMGAVALGLTFAFVTVVESIPIFFIEPCRA